MNFLLSSLWRRSLKIDEVFMKVALNLAEMGKGMTSPNPLVGAVIVKNGKIIGKGFHKRAGENHAEVIALEEAGEKAEGGTLYVNLEPCVHWGRTPPCVERIRSAKIRRVVIGTIDPNPLVNSKGVEFLRRNGIEVRTGILEKEAKEINFSFFKSITKRMPFVAIKMAMTLDGKVATWTGESKWISSKESRNYVHLLRSEFDAIMVGVGTIIKDDPLLTIRYGKPKKIIRVILDSNLSIPENSKILGTLDSGKVIIFKAKNENLEKTERLKAKGVDIVFLENGDKIPLKKVLFHLNEMGVNSLLVEGGPTLVTSLFEESLVDRVYIFVSPLLIGGQSAPTFFEGKGSQKISDSLKLENLKNFCIGKDTVIIGDVKCSQE